MPKGIDPGFDYSVGEAKFGRRLSQDEYDFWKDDPARWQKLTPGDWQTAQRPARVPLRDLPIKLGHRLHDHSAVVDELRLVLGADKKCGDATRIIIIGNLRFRIRQDQCKLFIRINFFVFLIVFNVFSDSID